MAIDRIGQTGSPDGVEPTDLGHRVVKLEWWKDELLRRLAIYEKRILILEGKRPPNRPDDMKEWSPSGVTKAAAALPDGNETLPDGDGGGNAGNAQGPLTPAEKQRAYRERKKAGETTRDGQDL